MSARNINILLIEDNPGDARLLEEILGEIPTIQFSLTRVEKLDLALQYLEVDRSEKFELNLILLDLSLPDSQGLTTFIKIYEKESSIPIIVLTGLDDENLAIAAMKQGAQDYLVKGKVNSDLLGRSIRYAIERKQAEQKIREQAALLDVATDAIYLKDLNKKILLWNKGAERMYGWSTEEVLGKHSEDIFYLELPPQLEEAWASVLNQGEWQGELHQQTKSLKKLVVASRWTLVRDRHEQPKAILIVDTDITEKIQLEEQFFRAQRLESLGTLASGIAHDLNNILTPILAASQLLPMRLVNADDRTKHLLKIVEESSKRGADLVKQILSFARGTEGKRANLQIGHLLQEIARIAQSTFPKSIEISKNISTRDLWTVWADSTQIHQVFLNLCVNARDAMPDGGKLTITTKNVFIDDKYTKIHLNTKIGSYVAISIEDTGCGMPKEILDRIFEPFFTTKEPGKGTGLGLSTTLGIIKSHGGFINVDSELGKGTEFTVYLPAIDRIETEKSKEEEFIGGCGELILVVDDESLIREITETTLSAYNYRVITASDGVEALALYVKHQDEISLVLTDLMMPSLGGLAIVRTLVKIDPKIKIIAFSGLESNSKLAEAAGVCKFLSKPYTTKDLLDTINQVLDSSP
jgi:two-component system, cell cycle sensor histidine kinase and response regulator CckA